jgi:hypothetical protein
MIDRDPFDGEPYYCANCSAVCNDSNYRGCAEYPCKLESRETAQARRRRRRPMNHIEQGE